MNDIILSTQNGEPVDETNDGLFQFREFTRDGRPCSGTQTMVTPKGRETFRLLMLGPQPGKE